MTVYLGVSLALQLISMLGARPIFAIRSLGTVFHALKLT
jgi:hypothetical protein